MADDALPLAGYRVVEIGHSVAAPYAGLILAELGAEVIKVERPGHGDDARAWGPPFIDEMSALFHALNRLKRSVTLDLKSPEGVAKLKALARISDVVIQNQKPGLAEALGVGAAALMAENPRLIYASIHAFGKEASSPTGVHTRVSPEADVGCRHIYANESSVAVHKKRVTGRFSGLDCCIGLLLGIETMLAG